MRGEDGPEGDEEVHEFTAEETEGIPVELVVDMFLEMSEHASHFVLRVVNHSSSCA